MVTRWTCGVDNSDINKYIHVHAYMYRGNVIGEHICPLPVSLRRVPRLFFTVRAYHVLGQRCLENRQFSRAIYDVRR